jgi:hypothetical protein
MLRYCLKIYERNISLRTQVENTLREEQYCVRVNRSTVDLLLAVRQEIWKALHRENVSKVKNKEHL